MEAVQLGAQDYILKSHLSAEGLGRSIGCAVERHRLINSLRGLSLTDELTGLLNRRGFSTLATGHLRLGSRTGSRFLLFFADLDGLKQINDTHGHHQGDEAIVRAAEILRRTFRQSHLGGPVFGRRVRGAGARLLGRRGRHRDAAAGREPPARERVGGTPVSPRRECRRGGVRFEHDHQPARNLRAGRCGALRREAGSPERPTGLMPRPRMWSAGTAPDPRPALSIGSRSHGDALQYRHAQPGSSSRKSPPSTTIGSGDSPLPALRNREGRRCP